MVIKKLTGMLVLVLMLSGCTSNDSSNTLSLASTIDFLDEHGVQLIEVNEIHPENVFNQTLNSVSPTFFKLIDYDDERLSIYVFASSLEISAAIEEFENKNETATLIPYEKYIVHNILIFYIFGDAPSPEVVFAIEEYQKSIRENE